MSDLVERLRESAKGWEREVETRLEAANEIERMQTQLDDINVADLIAQKGRDEALLRQALAALEQAGQIDTYRNYYMEDDAMKALKERLKC